MGEKKRKPSQWVLAFSITVHILLGSLVLAASLDAQSFKLPKSPQELQSHIEKQHRSLTPAYEALLQNTGSAIPATDYLQCYDQYWAALDAVHNYLQAILHLHSDDEIKALASHERKKIERLQDQLYANSKIFKQLLSYDVNSQAQMESRYLHLILIEAKKRGAHLDHRKQAIVLGLRDQLNNLKIQFEDNIKNSPVNLVFQRYELEGLPEDSLRSLTEIEPGLFLVKAHLGDIYFDIMSYVRVRETRRKLEQALQTRAVALKNVEIFEQILALRKEIAIRTGYKSWAEYQLDGLNFGNVSSLSRFLNLSFKTIEKSFQSEKKEIQKLSDVPVEAWDADFLLNKINGTSENKESEIRAHFETRPSLIRIIEWIAEAFQIDLRVDETIETWDPLVVVADLYEHGELKSRLYIDAFQRPGREEWPQVARIQPRLSNQIGETLVLLGHAPIDTGTRSFMSISDVGTAFHELGHALNEALNKIQYAFLAGYQASFDIVEVHSSLFEFKGSQPSTLTEIGRHFQTGKPMETSLQHYLEDHYAAHSPHGYRYFLAETLTDLNLNLARIPRGIKKLSDRYLGDGYYAMPRHLHPLASQSHFVSFYDSRYWVYFFSEVVATWLQDLMDTPAGRKLLKEKLYEAGNSVPVDKLLKDLRGRSFKACTEALRFIRDI